MGFLEKYGLALNNAILAEEKHVPLYHELVKEYPVQYIAGGATQNSIRVAQWMLKVPHATSYFGCVGSDEFAAEMTRSAEAVGVHAHYQVNPNLPTGTCAVLIHGGERSLVANLSAANTFGPAHLEDETSRAMIESARLYYSAGFALTVSVDALLQVARHCAEHNKVYAFNLSAPFLCQFFKDQMAQVMPYMDIVFGNESEAAAYGEAHGLGSDIKTVMRAISALPKANGTRGRTVIITQGKDATLVAHEGVVTEFAVELLPKELLVDTNGAGDSFVGGFLAQFVQGKEMSECVRAGHWAARVVIQRSGCTFPDVCEFA